MAGSSNRRSAAVRRAARPPAPPPKGEHTRHVALASASLALFLLALLLRFGASSDPRLEILRYLPLPGLLAPVAVLAVLCWRAGGGWRVLGLADLLLTATLIMGLSVGRADEGHGAFRFMTYNIKSYLVTHSRAGLARLAWEIVADDPDLLVMQDAGTADDDAVASAPLWAALGGYQVYSSDQYVVASRFPLTGCGTGPLAPGPGGIVYVHCLVTVHGRPLDLFTAHLESPREGLNAARGRGPGGWDEWKLNFAERLAESRVLAAVVARAQHPVIVAGDLNADEHSLVVRQLKADGLRDAFGQAGLGYGYTYGHDLRPGFSFLRLDHVLVGPSLGVRACHPGGRDGSPHRPVIADLLVERD